MLLLVRRSGTFVFAFRLLLSTIRFLIVTGPTMNGTAESVWMRCVTASGDATLLPAYAMAWFALCLKDRTCVCAGPAWNAL